LENKTLKIYNSLTREIEEFRPARGRKIFMYVCGPTVYDYMHLGHMKTYVFYDVLARYLSYKGFTVYFLMNITDVDDKIINRAIERRIIVSLSKSEKKVGELIGEFQVGFEYIRDRIIELIKSGYVELYGHPEMRDELIRLERNILQADEEERKRYEETYENLKRWIREDSLVKITSAGVKVVEEIEANNLKLDPIGLAREFEKYFKEDLEKLGINTITMFARASEFIDEIVELASKLIEKGYAYDTPTALYFDSSKFKEYGKLSGVDPEREYRVHRIEPDPNKKNDADWALWRKIREGYPKEPAWNSPWGLGRPGWHIEDTTIIIEMLGDQIDIHGGAKELMFPHHEAEIAQAEAYTDVKPCVRYWVHTDVLTVNGKKMSKSLGNYITVRDALKIFDPEVLRYWVLLTRYRHRMDLRLPFDPDPLNPIKPEHLLETPIKQAEQGLERLYNVIRYASSMPRDERYDEDSKKIEEELELMKERILEALDNDIDTARALAELHEYATKFFKYCQERKTINMQVAEKTIKVFREIGSILGILQKDLEKISDEKVKELIKLIVGIREKLRKNKQYELADEIRQKLKEIGIILEDTPQGTLVHIT